MLSRSSQIIDDKYINPGALKDYMKANFAPGTWTVQVRPC